MTGFRRAPLVGVLFSTMFASAEVPKPLTLCAGRDNMPMSQDAMPLGFEADIGAVVAKELGTHVQFEWLQTHTESFEQALLDGRCHAALGAIVDPGTMAGDRRVPGILLTRPYYAAGYVLIRRVEAKPVRELSEIRDQRIAIERESIATYSLRQAGHSVHVVKDYRAVLNALANGRAQYGYIWGPVALWLVRGRTDIIYADGFNSDRWRFAMAVSEKNAGLHNALDKAIHKVIESGDAARVFRSYGVGDLLP